MVEFNADRLVTVWGDSEVDAGRYGGSVSAEIVAATTTRYTVPLAALLARRSTDDASGGEHDRRPATLRGRPLDASRDYFESGTHARALRASTHPPLWVRVLGRLRWGKRTDPHEAIQQNEAIQRANAQLQRSAPDLAVRDPASLLIGIGRRR